MLLGCKDENLAIFLVFKYKLKYVQVSFNFNRDHVFKLIIIVHFSLILRFLFKHRRTSRPRTIQEKSMNRVKQNANLIILILLRYLISMSYVILVIYCILCINESKAIAKK